MSQLFTNSNQQNLKPLQLSNLASKYRAEQTNFLAFDNKQYKGVSNTPERVEKYNLNDTFGEKGGYKFKYGLNANQDVGWSTPESILKVPTKELARGVIVIKDGQKKCTPGYDLRNGECVASVSQSDIDCLPGWSKRGGICVKGGREFQGGEESADGPDVVLRSAKEIMDTGLGDNERRVYLQSESLKGGCDSTNVMIFAACAV